MGWLAIALQYAPAGLRNAAWIIRFQRWREAKAAKGELDSQKVGK